MADSPVRRPGPGRARPLRRKPKELDEEPSLFAPTPGGAGGLILIGSGDRRPGARPAPPGGVSSGETDATAELVVAPADGAGPDPQTRRRALQIAVRLALRRPRRDARSERGIGQLASLPYGGSSDDIDLDRTLEVLTERPVPEDSGSMRGERVRTAVATVGALAAELVRDDLSVVAFWSDAAVLTRVGQPVQPVQLLDMPLRIPARRRPGSPSPSRPTAATGRAAGRVGGQGRRTGARTSGTRVRGPAQGPELSRRGPGAQRVAA